MKKWIKSVLAVAACFGVCAMSAPRTATRATAATGVVIEDENLRSLIIETLELSSDVITENDMKGLTRLDTPSNDPAEKIVSLRGLEYAVNLTYLNLDYNKITDLTPIQNLTKLETLDISYNNGVQEGTDGITDVSCLKNLVNLTRFSSIGNDGVKDYSVVAKFKKLTYLNLSICALSSADFVSGLTALEKLYLPFNKISSAKPLANLTSLQTLALDNNQISDISCLKKLTNLKRFTVSNNNLTSVSVAYKFPALEKLDVSRNYLSDETIETLMEKITQAEVIVGPVKEGKPPVVELGKAVKKGCFGSIGSAFLFVPFALSFGVILKRKGRNEK